MEVGCGDEKHTMHAHINLVDMWTVALVVSKATRDSSMTFCVPQGSSSAPPPKLLTRAAPLHMRAVCSILSGRSW